ncbi:MAG: hypothetical protein ACO1SV_22895 [Fimbriimonas sp.]
MSEQNRQKKDGEGKNAKNSRMEEQAVDPRQGTDRPGVHNERQPADSVSEDLARDSRQTRRGSGNDKPLTDPSKPAPSK